MAYLLFANNLVDYADKYRGMQSVVLHGLEAFADVLLSSEKGGSGPVLLISSTVWPILQVSS